jgi:hypothetical protein
MPVVTAEFEADALIKGAFQKKEFQLVMSNDADYPVDLGDNCFAIKEFGHKNLVITSTCKESLLSVMSSLGDSSKSTLIEPQWPIYEGVLNYRLRALISVIIGCDVCPGGLPGWNLKKMATELAKLKSTSSSDADDDALVYYTLLGYAVKSGPFTEEVLTCFIDAIVYQPTNILGWEGPRTYIYSEPLQLPEYLKEFECAGTTVVIGGPDILQCKGPCFGSSHTFLAEVRHYRCKQCNELV